MRIGICDDMKNFRTEIIRIINSIDLKFDYDVVEYCSAEELLVEKEIPDLLFLDIEMSGLTGIELLRNYSPLFSKTKVVFTTSHKNFSFEGYEVNAFRYLLKPVQPEKIIEIFASLEKMSALEQSYTFTNEGNTYSIKYSKIIYFTKGAAKNSCDMVTLQNSISCNDTLKNISQHLPEKYFMQCHRSFIVNLTQIKKVDSKNRILEMNDGSKIPIARNSLNKFLLLYMELF